MSDPMKDAEELRSLEYAMPARREGRSSLAILALVFGITNFIGFAIIFSAQIYETRRPNLIFDTLNVILEMSAYCLFAIAVFGIIAAVISIARRRRILMASIGLALCVIPELFLLFILEMGY